MARRPGYWIKLIAGNVLVLFVLLCAVNFVAATLYDARSFLEETLIGVDEKAYRDALDGSPNAEQIFREFARLQTRYVPFVEWRRAPFRGETTTVDEAGNRVHPPTTSTPVGRARFFGGSTMWGKGVDDAHSIPAAFNALHPDFTVHNHGESGFVSRQSFEQLVNLVNQDEPMDLVVFYDGCNDFFTLCRADTSLNGHSRENEMIHKFRPPSMMIEAVSGALRDVIFWAWGRSLKTAGPGSRCQHDPAGAARVAKTLINNWRLAKRVADEAGAEFHAILQPVAVVGAPNVAHLGYLQGTPSQRSGDYEAVYPIVRSMIRESGEAWMHDFTDALDGNEVVYIDGCHLNARGNEIIARRMNDTLGDGWSARAMRRAAGIDVHASLY